MDKWEYPTWEWDEKKEDKQKAEGKKLILKKKFLEKSHIRAKLISDFIPELPKENEQFIIITLQSFNAFAIFLHLQSKMKIKELYLTTFSIDQNTTDEIIDFAKLNENIKTTLVVTSLLKYDRGQRRQKLIDASKQIKNFKFIEAFNHTKIILAKSDKGFFVIEGSGNLSANARIEQYRFENSKETYNFHKNWIDNIKELSATKDVLIFN